ncbi:MAG: Hsp70 family protein [Austwickia sp.]|nr:Hsp70 family protein [Actinomycetota bacterium]MCB1251741.1 Hsp70 family protein [Austwickia sp.]MCO5308518.1 Hsp70 family protein [Austwickia sp.]
MADPVFGIDLGTTYSAIAYINDYGQAEVIRNSEGQETTPSVVYFESDTSYVVGREAKNTALAYPDDTVSLIKRQMGNRVEMEHFGKAHSPETISALILTDLVRTAQEATGIQSNRVVITVPAYFGLTERGATRQAGEIAGLEVVGVVTEPVAAALSAGIKGDAEKTLFVYDLGGGTFDCTVMRVSPAGVEVIVTDGNRLLGGADWDVALFDLIVEKFQARANLTEDPAEDSDFVQKLSNDVEQCKITLTKKQKATVPCRYAGATEIIEVTREEFEERTRPLVERTLDIVRRAKEDAERRHPGISFDEVLLVGGSARMPMISQSLTDTFGWELTKTDFDLAVAKGAAIYGQGASGFADRDITGGEGGSGDDGDRRTAVGEGDGAATVDPDAPKQLLIGGRTMSISGVLSRGLGILFVRDNPTTGAMEEYVEFLAHKDDPVPLDIEVHAGTYSANQTEAQVAIYEQAGDVESEDKANSRELPPGCEFTGLPPLPKNSPIDITVHIDAEGLSTITAYEPTSGRRLTATAQLSVLSEAEQAAAKEMVSGLVRRDD